MEANQTWEAKSSSNSHEQQEEMLSDSDKSLDNAKCQPVKMYHS
jgi:hypothetical protein